MAAEDHLPDDFLEEEVDEYVSTSCKYCHTSGLVWADLSGNYRLVDQASRELHTCKAYVSKRNMPEKKMRNS